MAQDPVGSLGCGNSGFKRWGRSFLDFPGALWTVPETDPPEQGTKGQEAKHKFGHPNFVKEFLRFLA